MYKHLETLPDSSRIWIYQSSRAFTQDEQKEIAVLLNNFVNTWNAHGSDLDASFSIKYDQFIIVSVNEAIASASGCSIDKSVGVIRSIESSLNVSLFERTTIAFLNSSDKVETFKLNEAKNKVEEGTLTPTTKIFDNTIQTLGDFRQRWVVEAQNSWLKRYFNVVTK